jgi:hypothetical protein
VYERGECRATRARDGAVAITRRGIGSRTSRAGSVACIDGESVTGIAVRASVLSTKKDSVPGQNPPQQRQ